MSASTEDARLQRIRRQYRRAGYRVWKVRDDSRWYPEFGPFSVIDESTNTIVDRGLDMEELERDTSTR